MVSPWNERDKEFIETLRELDLPKNEAIVLTHIFRVTQTTSRDIELRTGLRQPEVSTAVRELIKKGWILKEDIPTKGKGRPAHMYTLRGTKGRVISSIESVQEHKMERINECLAKLKRLAK